MYCVKVTPIKGKALLMYKKDFEEAAALYENVKLVGVEIQKSEEEFLWWPVWAIAAVELSKEP